MIKVHRHYIEFYLFQAFIFFSLGLLCSCGGLHAQEAKATKSNFIAPEIKLISFEVPQYDGYWYFSKSVRPTKGDAGDRGAPLPMSFLFSIANPNDFTVCLESFHFTVSFEGFELVTINDKASYFIPPGKRDDIRADSLITVRSSLLNILVTAGYKCKERGMSPWELLERWWKGVPNKDVKVNLTKGAFKFSADNINLVCSFQAKVQ